MWGTQKTQLPWRGTRRLDFGEDTGRAEAFSMLSDKRRGEQFTSLGHSLLDPAAVVLRKERISLVFPLIDAKLHCIAQGGSKKPIDRSPQLFPITSGRTLGLEHICLELASRRLQRHDLHLATPYSSVPEK